MKQYITRAYNSFEFNYRNSTIKKFSKEQRLLQETDFYKNVPKSLAIYFPRLIDSGFLAQEGKYFLELELFPYENLGKLLVEGKLNFDQWVDIAKHITEIIEEFQGVSLNSAFIADMKAMYFDKTEVEYLKLKEGFSLFGELCSQKTVQINGKEYLNFEQIWPQIKNKYEQLLLDLKIKPSIIHGDFCFSNILVGFLPNGKSILRFVDPRGKFGNFGVYGDPYYDLAKLMHSTDVGYEYIIYDMFSIERVNNHSFNISFANSNKEVVNNIFKQQIYSKFNEQRIKLIQASIYIGMCARHYDSEQRQMVMYLSGIKLLNELLTA